jgi:hypothetical protein
MKLNKIKRVKKEFNPVHHWYMILLAFLICTTLIVVYSVYSFFFIKGEIVSIDAEAQINAQNANSAEVLEKSRTNGKFLKDINNLNKTLDEFNKKEVEYNRLIKSAVAVPTSASTTASSTVATSTN